jgi:hypothetical protein
MRSALLCLSSLCLTVQVDDAGLLSVMTVAAR